MMIPSLYGVGVRDIMKRTPYLGKHFVRTAVASEAKLAREAAKGAFRKGVETTGKVVGSMAGKGLYEGVVEEGGQGVMQRAAADYALLSGIRKDTGMGDMWDSVAEGMSGSYGTAEGQSEVVIGAMLGALGMPVSIKGTGLTGVDAYRKADTRRKVMEMLIKMQEKNPSVLNSVRTNAYFHENVSKRSDLKDSAYEGGDMALVKDLEFDDFFDYVTVKLLTGQYEDIEDQNKQILEMSPEEFRAWGQYTTENLADDQIASRQSEVVAAVRERARAIQEVTNQVDSQIRITDEEKVLGLQKPGTRGYNRLQVIHALASIKNTEEREEALTAIVAKLTGGRLSSTAWSMEDTGGAEAQDRTSTIEYTDAEGNIKSVDIGAFTDENQTRGTLASILSVIKTLEAQEKTPEISEKLKNLYASRDTVAKIAALEGTDNALTAEEYEQIVAPWKAADPTGFNIHAEEVFTALADIRKLRAKRQEAGELYKKLMDPAYEMQTIQAIVDKINTLPQEATPEEAEAKKEAKEAEKKKAEQKTKRGLKTFLNRLKLARTAKIQDLKRIEEEIAALKTYLNEYLEELTAKKGDLWVMDWKKNAGTVKELKEAIENIEKEVETAEAWLADLQKDRDNVVEILTLMDEFEKSPPDTSTYSKEIYGSTKALADALGIEIDFKEVPKTSALAVKEEIKAFKEDMEKHAEAMGFAAEELREQLDNLLEYKDILTRTLNTHIEEARKEGIEWDPADVRWLRQELKVTDTALEKTKQAFDFVQKRSERSGSIVNNLDESYTRLWTYKFIQSMRVTEVEDEQEDDTKPKAKGVTPSVQTAEEVEKTEGKPGLRKTHIKDGMGRTVGSHESDKELGVLNGALDTYKRLKAEIYLDEREKIELKIAESQLRWFNWMQSTPANGQYSLAAITINNIPEELDGVLTQDMFYDETDIKLVAYHNYDRRAETAKEKAAREQSDKKRKKPSYYKKKDISRNKFVILDSEAWEDRATVKTKAAVFTSAMLPYATTKKGAPRFRGMDIKKGEITQSEIEDIEQAHEIWRDNILESAKEENGKKVYLFPVTGKSNGAPVEGDLEQNSKKIKGNSDFASIPLFIGTTAKGVETPIELNVGTMAVTTRAGIVWAFDSVRENAVRMTSRTLDDQEVVNVARLLHKFLDVRGKSKAKSVTDKWKEARNYEFEIDGTTITLEKAIQSIIYMGGAYKQKESKEFQLRYEKGVLIFGDKNQEIDLENFELGDESEVYNSFITFLRTKLHNVDKGLASKSTKQYSNSTKGEKNYNTYKANPESKYVEVILDESLDHLAESTVWDNYNSYLLTPRTDKRLSPLRTRQKSILPNNGATSLDAPTHKGGYWSFESNMNTASVFTKEGQKPKTASADRQQEAWTEEDDEASQSTGEELGAMAADQGVKRKVDITDIQDSEVEVVTYKGTKYSVDFNVGSGTITNLKTGKVLEGGVTSPVGQAVVDKAIAQQDSAQQTSKDEAKKADIEKRREEDRQRAGKDSVLSKLREKLSPGSSTISNMLRDLGAELQVPIKIKEGEITHIVFDREESSFVFTHKGKKFSAFYIKNVKGKTRWQISEWNTETDSFTPISLGSIKQVNEKYGSAEEMLREFAPEVVDDIIYYENLEYSEEDKAQPFIPLENSVSAEQVRLQEKYGNKFTLKDFLAQWDKELAALEQAPPAKKKKGTKGDPSKKMSNAAIVALQKRMGVKKVDDLGFTKKPQAPSDQDDNEPFGPALESNYTLPSEEYLEEEFGEELRRIQEMMDLELGSIDPKTKKFRAEQGKRVAGLISVMGGEGYAMLSDFGKVVVSELAPGGALYHEGFHNISLHILSPRDRAILYNQVRSIEGKALPYKEIARSEQDPKYKPKSKSLSEFTDKEAEEWLAEEFRRYALSKGKYSVGKDTVTKEQKGFFESLFDTLRDVIRYILRTMRLGTDLSPNEMSVESMEAIDSLFNKIASGKFKGVQKNTLNAFTESPAMAASMILNEQSSSFEADAVSSLTAYMTRSLGKDLTLRTGETVRMDFKDFLTESLPANVQDLESAQLRVYGEAFVRMKKDLEEGIENKSIPSDVRAQMANTLYYFWDPDASVASSRRSNLYQLHSEYLRQLGVDVEVEDERSEDEVSAAFVDSATKLETSPTNAASGIVKFLLGTIPNASETNSLGLEGVYPLASVSQNLQTELEGTMMYRDQLEKVAGLQSRFPWAEEVLQRLGKYVKDGTEDYSTVKIQVAFAMQMKKTLYNISMQTLQETGRMYDFDPGLEKNLRVIRGRWMSRARIQSRKNQHVKISRGRLVYDPKSAVKFNNRRQTLKEIEKQLTGARTEFKLDALALIGFEFDESVRERLLEKIRLNENFPGISESYKQVIDDAVAFLYQDITSERSTQMVDLFNRENAVTVTRTNRLAKIQMRLSDTPNEISRQMPDGKIGYALAPNNTVSTISNIPIGQLQNTYYPSEDNLDKNPFAFSSLTLEVLRGDTEAEAENSGKLDVFIRDGLAIEGAGQVGVKTSKLRATDNLASYVETIMNGIFPVLRAADISTDFAVKFPIKDYKSMSANKNEVMQILLNYLEDEIVAANVGITENVQIKQFTDVIGAKEQGMGPLRMFQTLVKHTSNEVRTNINKFVEDPDVTRDDIGEFIDTYAEDELMPSMERVLREDMQELKDFMNEYNLININADNTIQLFGINREHFGKEELPEKVSSEKFDKFLEEIIVKNTIYKNELFKMFLGDPAFYSDLYKRLKGAVGVRDMFIVDPELDNWLNNEEYSRTKGKGDGKIADGTETMMVVQEPTARTKFLAQYTQELSPKVAEQWQKDIDKADATILVPLHVYKEMAIRGDVWGADQNEVYNNMWDGTNYNRSEYPFGTFPPLKFQYNGYLPDGGRKTVSPGFFKMSVAPIFPQMANIGNENFTGVDRMYNFLKKNQLGGIIVPSAFKVGAPVVSDQVKLFDGPMIKSEDRLEQALLDTVGKGEVLIDYTFMGTQLEVPSKFKGKSPIATQARVQVLSDLFENGELIDESLRENIEEYNEVFDELITRGYKSLLDELNLEESSENGVTSYKVINDNYTPFIEALKGESIRREMPPQVLSSLEALQGRNDTDKPMYFDLVSNKARLEGVLWSMAAKKVIKQKFKGDMYVQMSSLGFEVAKQGTNTSDEASRLKPLPAYDLREENPQLNVYLPHYFKEFVDENVVITSRGIESNGRVISRDTSLLNLIGIRIPTDGIHSIESIKVAGFLDPKMGPTIIVPSELVTKSGSDFDIDKLVLYFPSYNIKNGKLVKESIPYSVEAWFENEKRSFKRSLETLKDMEEVMTVERLLNTTQEEREAIEKLISEMFSSKLLEDDTASNIFGEALRETGGVTLEQSERLAMYLNTDPELAVKSYRRIKKIVEDKKIFDQTFEGWLAQDNNSEETIYTVASRGALQNSVMENMNTFITHPSRRNVFLNPVQTTEWNRLADMLLDMYRNSPEDIDMSQMKDYHKQTNIPYVVRVSEAFNKAKDLVGIEALTSTHHVKAQRADLKLYLGSTLALPSDAYSENRINFAGFEAENDAGVASLARVRQKETVAAYVAFREYMADNPEADENVVIDDFIPRISDTISQGVNVTVDAVNNPIMHLLKITPDNASAWTLLTRLGVDMETIAMFMNQPIVKDYLKMSDIGRSRTAKVSDTAIYDDKIATKLKNRYATNALAPDVPTAFTARQLKEMIQDSNLKNHTNMTDIEKRQQLQILTDMFRYMHIGTALSDIVNAQSFDTKAPKNRNQLKITLANYKTALSSGLFENAEKIAGMDIPNVDTTQPTTDTRKYTPENITSLEPNQVFVFGANTAGGHGGGTAGLAQRGNAKSNYTALPQGTKGKWAEYGVVDQLMEGTEGKSFGIVTKSASVSGTKLKIGSRRSVPLERIEQSINSLIETANNNPELEFLVTKFGTNMAGFTVTEMKSLLEGKSLPDNIILPKEFETRPSQPTTEVTEGVSEVFESNPELAEIGTEEQYNAYLDTVFPDSKVKDIVYHGTDIEFEEFLENELLYFGTKKIAKGYGKILKPVLLNIQNPYYESVGNLSTEDYHILQERLEENNSDGFISDGKKNLFAVDTTQENQIHILGSKKDIQGFKDFVDGAGSPATFMKSMTKYNYDMQNMFNDLYITDKLTKEAKVAYDRVLNEVIKVFTNPKIKGLSIDDKGKILNKFEDGFISFVVQRMASTVDGIALGASLENLMFGEQSMAMRIADIQDPDGNHPLRDNLFIQALIPVISPVRSSDKEGYTNDYLTPTNKTMTPYEMKQLYDGFLEIAATDNKLSSDIIKTAYFQAGTGSTVSSFLNLIPGEAIMITLSKPIDKFLKTSEDFVQEIPNYYQEFFQNNHYNNDIVPKHNDYSKLVYPMTYLLDKKSKEAYKIALKAGEVPPPIKKVYFWNATGTSKAEVVRGSRSLENYTGISRIPSNNAKQQGRSKKDKYRKNKKNPCKK